MYYANTNQKKAGVVILISEKANLRARKIIRGKSSEECIMHISMYNDKGVTSPRRHNSP